MMHKNPILKIKEAVQHWPDTKPEHFKCTLLASDNTQYDVDLHKTEVELEKFFTSIRHKLSVTEISKLKDLIDDYGFRRWEEGTNSNAEETN